MIAAQRPVAVLGMMNREHRNVEQHIEEQKRNESDGDAEMFGPALDGLKSMSSTSSSSSSASLDTTESGTKPFRSFDTKDGTDSRVLAGEKVKRGLEYAALTPTRSGVDRVSRQVPPPLRPPQQGGRGGEHQPVGAPRQRKQSDNLKEPPQTAGALLCAPQQSVNNKVPQPKVAKKKGRFQILADVDDIGTVAPAGVVSLSSSTSASPTPLTDGMESAVACIGQNIPSLGEVASSENVYTDDGTGATQRAGIDRNGSSGGSPSAKTVVMSNESDSPGLQIIVSAAAVVGGDVGDLDQVDETHAVGVPPPVAGSTQGMRHQTSAISPVDGLSNSTTQGVARAPQQPQMKKKGRFVVVNSAPQPAAETSTPGMNITAALGLLAGEKGLTPVSVVAIPPVSPSAVVGLGEAAKVNAEDATNAIPSPPIAAENVPPAKEGSTGNMGHSKMNVESISAAAPVPLKAALPVSVRTTQASPLHSTESRIGSSPWDHKGSAGFGKVLYFLDQMKLEVTEADKTNRNLVQDMKFMREKNKELEAKNRELEKRLAEEKGLRESAEARARQMKKKLQEMRRKEVTVEEGSSGSQLPRAENTVVDSCDAIGVHGHSSLPVKSLGSAVTHLKGEDSTRVVDADGSSMTATKVPRKMSTASDKLNIKSASKPARTSSEGSSRGSTDGLSEQSSGHKPVKTGNKVVHMRPPLHANLTKTRMESDELGSVRSVESRAPVKQGEQSQNPRAPIGSSLPSHRDRTSVANQAHLPLPQHVKAGAPPDPAGPVGDKNRRCRSTSDFDPLTQSQQGAPLPLLGQQILDGGVQNGEKIYSCENGNVAVALMDPSACYRFNPMSGVTQEPSRFAMSPVTVAPEMKPRKVTNANDFDPLYLGEQNLAVKNGAQCHEVVNKEMTRGNAVAGFPSRDNSFDGNNSINGQMGTQGLGQNGVASAHTVSPCFTTSVTRAQVIPAQQHSRTQSERQTQSSQKTITGAEANHFSQNWQQKSREAVVQHGGAVATVQESAQLSSSWQASESMQTVPTQESSSQQKVQNHQTHTQNGHSQNFPQQADPFDELAVRRTSNL